MNSTKISPKKKKSGKNDVFLPDVSSDLDHCLNADLDISNTLDTVVKATQEVNLTVNSSKVSSLISS